MDKNFGIVQHSTYICSDFYTSDPHFMANIELSLSMKSREDGKRQVLVRISRGRSIRFRIKSGVYVSPEYWNDDDKCIKVPVFRKINKASVETAKAEKAEKAPKATKKNKE